MKSKILRLKDRAWKVFSKFIRQRDPKCVTCGAPTTQAGHFWHNTLDFDEMNVNGQCTKCNHYLSGNLAIYSSYLIDKYGLEKFNDLKIRHYRDMIKHYTEEDYERLINRYTRKLG